MRNRLKRVLIIILIILIIAIGAMEVKNYIKPESKSQTLMKKNINIGPYKINENQTEYMKQLAEELKTAYDTNPDSDALLYALTKYFVADYYTLRNKFVMADVGGMGLVYPVISKTFKQNAIDSYYMDITEYRNEYGVDNLPEVASIKVSKPEKINMAAIRLNDELKEKAKDFRDIVVDWTYVDNDVVNPVQLKLVNKSVIRLVKDVDGTWWIYEILADDGK